MRLVVTGLCLAACGRFDFGDAATIDANADATTDASTDVSTDAAGGCPSFALFCDGFESGDLSKWSGEDVPAAQTVDAAAKYTGAYGYDAVVPSNMGAGAEGDAYVGHGTTFATGTLAVREWVYAPAQLIDYVGTLELTLGPPATAAQYLEVNANDVGDWSLSEYGSAAGLHDHPGSVAAQAGTWTCVELVIELGAAASMTIYIDGAISAAGALSNTGLDYDTIAVGVTRANAGGFEVYIDDVAIATQRIGC